MKKVLTIIVALLCTLITSCKNNSKISVNEEASINSNFMTLLKRYHDNDGYVATASDTGVYMLDKGVIKYVDLETFKETSIATLNISDDKEILGYCSSYKKYCEQAVDNYLQYFDGHLYYVIERRTIEGDYTIALNRMNPNGTIQEEVFLIDEGSYLFTVTNGRLFYIERSTQNVMVANLNTYEAKQIDIPKGQSFGQFFASEEYFYIQTYNNTNPIFYLYSYDFKTDNLILIISGENQPLDGDGDKLLLYEITGWEPFTFNRKVINHRMEVITEINDDTRLFNYLDSEYIYTSSIQSPQRYIVYDHQGNALYNIEVPMEFRPYEMKIRGLNGPIEASEIQGVIDDYLFVVGGAEDRIRYYLINFKTGEWHEVFQSVIEVSNNGQS